MAHSIAPFGLALRPVVRAAQPVPVYAQESSNLVIGGILAEASIRTLALSQRIQMEQATAIFESLF